MEETDGVKPNDNIVPFETLESKLLKVQTELVAKKTEDNNHHRYKFRNVETILSEVKPLLKANGLSMIMTDNLIELSGEVYVEARVIIKDITAQDLEPTNGYPKEIVSRAFAREPKGQSGMSPSQQTGTAGSYARKYALGALFLISGEACPDYVDEIESNLDSFPTPQDKGKGKGKGKSLGKAIIIPKLGRVTQDVEENLGNQTRVPVDGKDLKIKDLDLKQLNFLIEHHQKFFKDTPVFLEALLKNTVFENKVRFDNSLVK